MTVHVIATDDCGNTIDDLVVIQLDEPPAFTLPALIAEGCSPLTVQMPDVGITTSVTYLWDFGDGTTSAASMPTHTYEAGTFDVTLTVTTSFGCTSTSPSSGQVIVHPTPVAAFTASPWTTDADHAEIDFTDQSIGNINVFDWDFGDGSTSDDQNPSHHYVDVGTFSVTLWVQDVNGCSDEVTQEVQIDPVYDVVVPNAFTPDPNGGGGGIYNPLDLGNDVFYPFIRFVEDFRMRIYDRWGELVFESKDINIGWDGYYRGEMSQQDVYVYQIWVRFVDDKEVQKLGDITLFR
jgi:gliding motility-associated-like protein